MITESQLVRSSVQFQLWNPDISTVQSQPPANFTLMRRAISQSKESSLQLCASPMAYLTSLNLKSLKPAQTKLRSLTRSTFLAWQLFVVSVLERQRALARAISTCIARVMLPSKPVNASTSTTQNQAQPLGGSAVSSGSPKPMRGQTKEFLRALRRKHGLGEFRASAGARDRSEGSSRVRGGSRGSRAGSRPRKSTRAIKKRRFPSGRLGFGL
jgi:hypothetical protein